jgi:prepilin-type N-terminal cleavage/methylation domain-containing protein
MLSEKNRQRRQFGLTLVEVVVTIIVLGIAATALLPMFSNVLTRSPDSSEIVRATYLAQSRMELILGQRATAGYSGVNDPCQAVVSIACAGHSGYSLTVIGMPAVVAWPVNTDTTRFRLVTVRVTGQSGSILSQLDAVIANY